MAPNVDNTVAAALLASPAKSQAKGRYGHYWLVSLCGFETGRHDTLEYHGYFSSEGNTTVAHYNFTR
jgi:hypothetical protein